jgi:ATP-binding cassette subfamily B protein
MSTASDSSVDPDAAADPDTDLTTGRALAAAARTAGHGIADAFRHARRWFLTAAALTLVHALIPPVEVLLLRLLLERLTDQQTAAADLAFVLAALTITVGLNFSLGPLALSASQRTGFRMSVHYRSELAVAAADLAPQQLADPRVVTRLQAASNAIERMNRVPGDSLQLVGTALTSIGLCAAIFGFSAVAGVLVLSALLPTVFAMTFIARSEAAGWPPVAAEARRSTYALEQLLQQRTGTELALLGSGRQVAGLVRHRQQRMMIMLDRLIAVDMRWESFASVATAVLLAAALVSIIVTDVGASLVAAAVAGILSGLSAIRFTGFAFGNIVATSPQAESYRQMTALPTARTAILRPVGSVTSITVDDLTVCYPKTVEPAVRQISLTARRGEIIALVGANGAGKTTTINAILGILRPSTGRILIDGVPVDELGQPEILARIGLLTQEFGRYEFTVAEAINLGRPDGPATDDELWAALQAVGLADLVAAMPLGLHTQLGQQWDGVGLSGGQWQRLALARIHLRGSRVWILDEPTSAVDAEAEAEIFAELQRTKGERITIVVSHRAWTLQGMDRIYVFDHGRIVQSGSFRELLAGPGRFAELFAEQLATGKNRPDSGDPAPG